MNPAYDMLPVFAQNLFWTIGGVWINQLRFSRLFHRTLARWEETIDGPLLHLHAEQRERLDWLVGHARRNVPYYKDLPPPSCKYDPETALEETLASIPPLDKGTYRRRWTELLARGVSTRRCIGSSTSGTTGTALRVLTTPERAAEYSAAFWRQRRHFGAQINDPHLTFTGRMVVPFRQQRPPYWRRNRYAGQTFFSVYHMSRENLSDYVDAIHDTPARYAHGYPSALHLAARAMLEAGRPIPKDRLVGVFPSSESLLSFQRETIEEAFGAPVRDHYAASEPAVSMTACAHDRLHVDMEYCIVEVEPLEESDEWVRGPLLVTGLGNDVLPFLRYRIGDVGTRAKTPCPCGRPGDSFFDIDGRVEDYVEAADGRLVGRLDHVFKSQRGVAEAQIHQQMPGAIEIHLVCATGWDDQAKASLLHELHRRLGETMKVELRIVESIPREPNGKFRAVKSFVGRLDPAATGENE